ncbi:FadR/GntR family transcriptional regulator [Hydrogenophaga electricum]|uniref:GntR family transcriptional regulator n=1 Tax=Hydrogenophaga electricum TaxID=1230953 RepID=A0ABQ6CAI1_9BURK|nr:FadR/GntR family transcriptional regulator [Hydrogenophaga electricum]GLS15207.1 GntR family transcriptional regulator [Hydrogenophaga electricum]
MSSSFSAVKPGLKLADQVASALEAEIRAGRLQVADKLPTETALAQQFQVSRTVVREALSRLKSRGLVDSRQGSGVYVQAPGIEPLQFDLPHAASREAVMQIVEVRRALEAEVAEMAALRRSEADLLAIRQAMAAIQAAVQAGRDGVEEDVQFHRAIARAAGNPFMINTLDYLAQFLKGATRVTRANEARRSDFSRAVTQEHEHIVQAIEAGDAVAARSAAAEHMRNALARIAQADPGFWTQDGARLAEPLLAAAPATPR